MAVFRSASQFDDNSLDLHAPYLTPPVAETHVTPGGSFRISGGYETVGFLAFHMDAFFRSYSDGGEISGPGASQMASGGRLVFDGAGAVTGGTVQMLHVDVTGGAQWNLVATQIDGAAYAAAVDSADTGDDRALFAAAMGGSDRIILSAFDDVIHAGGGRDMVLGKSGSDQLYGEGGNDLMDGGKGRDLLDGGIGADLLFGGRGNDTLLGGGGDDILWGSGGTKDVLTGGAGQDDFIFAGNFGDETALVTDFVHGVDHILIEIADSATGEALTFANFGIRQTAEGALIRHADPLSGVVVKMLLQGVDAASLTAADFLSYSSPADDPIHLAYAPFVNNWNYWG